MERKMEPFKQLMFKDHSATIENYLDVFLKNESKDCILYSQDGSEIRIHKDLFSQTNFLRKILSSAKEQCCGILEILCPCTKKELSHLVNFLYDGEIHCENENDSIEIQENLIKIFGFPNNLSLNDPNRFPICPLAYGGPPAPLSLQIHWRLGRCLAL